MALHKGFGKIFRAFQYGTSLCRPNHGNVLGTWVCLHVVVNTFHQRVFRTHYHHADLLVDTELFDGFEVISFHRHILTAVARSGITWGNIQFLTFLTLSNFPSQCVLTSATA